VHTIDAKPTFPPNEIEDLAPACGICNAVVLGTLGWAAWWSVFAFCWSIA